jgi:hypothetical protein
MTKEQLLSSLQEAVSGLDVGKAKATVESDRSVLFIFSVLNSPIHKKPLMSDLKS